MNGKKKTLILIGLFAVLMTGASFLYNSLSKNYKMDSLIVENKTNFSTNNSNADTDSQNSEITSGNDSSNSDTNSSDSAASDSSNSSSYEKDNSNASNSSYEDNNSSSSNIAPDFTVYNLEGNQVNLSDFFGKPVIVNFWASWCGPCQMEMPDFDTAYANYKDNIEFLMVNMTDGSRETVEKASSFIEEKGYSFPVYYDNDYSAAITYSVSSLPTTYFIDSDGNLIAHAKGAIDADTLQRGIDMIYKEK